MSLYTRFYTAPKCDITEVEIQVSFPPGTVLTGYKWQLHGCYART